MRLAGVEQTDAITRFSGKHKQEERIPIST
jgi:hypothetical protein